MVPAGSPPLGAYGQGTTAGLELLVMQALPGGLVPVVLQTTPCPLPEPISTSGDVWLLLSSKSACDQWKTLTLPMVPPLLYSSSTRMSLSECEPVNALDWFRFSFSKNQKPI